MPGPIKPCRIICDIDGTLALSEGMYSEEIDKLEYQRLWERTYFAPYKDGLIFKDGNVNLYYQKNEALIAVLENADEAGCKIDIATDGDRRVMGRILHNLDVPEDLLRISSKREIETNGVNIIIDDKEDSQFVRQVLAENPKAIYIKPHETEKLAKLLGVFPTRAEGHSR